MADSDDDNPPVLQIDPNRDGRQFNGGKRPGAGRPRGGDPGIYGYKSIFDSPPRKLIPYAGKESALTPSGVLSYLNPISTANAAPMYNEMTDNGTPGGQSSSDMNQESWLTTLMRKLSHTGAVNPTGPLSPYGPYGVPGKAGTQSGPPGYFATHPNPPPPVPGPFSAAAASPTGYGRGLSIPQGNVGFPSPAPAQAPAAIAPTSPGVLSAAMQPGMQGTPSGPSSNTQNEALGYGGMGAALSHPTANPLTTGNPLTGGNPLNIAPANAGSGQGVPLAGLNPPGTPTGNMTPATTSSPNLLQQFAALLGLGNSNSVPSPTYAPNSSQGGIY